MTDLQEDSFAQVEATKMEINKTGFREVVSFVFYSSYGLVDIQVAELRL